jgi:hypothetical protein
MNMKKMSLLILISIAFPVVLHAQNIDRSLYREFKTFPNPYEERRRLAEERVLCKTMAHLDFVNGSPASHWQINFEVDWQGDPNYGQAGFESFRYYRNPQQMRKFQVAIVYYHYEASGSFGVNPTLDDIELVENHFVIGTRYKVQDNLRLRSVAGLSGDIITLIRKGELITVLEEGGIETIDGITSVWVKIRLPNGTEGWCFEGYLGFEI